MRAIVAKKALLRVLARCVAVADRRSSMPVLGNVRLDAEGAGLTVSATDLYLAVSGQAFAEVDKPGGICVGAKELLDRVKAMPDGQISIEAGEDSSVSIGHAGSKRRFKIMGLPAEEFPKLPDLGLNADDGLKTKLDQEVLSSLIAHTDFAISPDVTRLHLNSALLEWDGTTVRMVATDGHRLSKFEQTTPQLKFRHTTILIPQKGVAAIKQLCDEQREGEEAEPVTLVATASHAFLGYAGFRLSVKLVDAQFPPYGSVIPESSERTTVVPRVAFAESLRAVSVAAGERTGGVRLTLGCGRMRLESDSPDTGSGFDELPVETTGEDITIGLNARYVLDALGALDCESVAVGTSGVLDPVTIAPSVVGSDTSFVAVVMPQRV